MVFQCRMGNVRFATSVMHIIHATSHISMLPMRSHSLALEPTGFVDAIATVAREVACEASRSASRSSQHVSFGCASLYECAAELFVDLLFENGVATNGDKAVLSGLIESEQSAVRLATIRHLRRALKCGRKLGPDHAERLMLEWF